MKFLRMLLLNCPTVPLNKYVAVDDNVSTPWILIYKEILEIAHNPNDCTHIDSGSKYKNRINYTFLASSILRIAKNY